MLAGLVYFASAGLPRIKDNRSDSSELVDSSVEKKLEGIKDTIQKNFYAYDDKRTVGIESMQDGMYKGLLNSLNDPYSVYYTQEELTQLMSDTEGVYQGIGAYVSVDDNGMPVITGVIDDSPAEEAGLRERDIIYMVEDTDVSGMDLSSVVSLIKGKEGTYVMLTIVRDGESDFLKINVERRKIETPTVTSKMLTDDVGLISISEFDEVTVDQFADARDGMLSSGARGLIIDLRSNPGGSLDSVVKICRMILPKGIIVYTEDVEGNRVDYECDGSSEISVPLVVLINGYSASASEIMAGAIKDYGVGTLVGTTTYGKGIVQRVIDLKDGTAIKLTIAAYYTPKGTNIQGTGIEPDVEVEFDSKAYYDDNKDNQMDKALEVLEGKIG
ncbi:MAG: S41 family peptidase [Lachnospiraceae bacterium]|nr:S41 family peptidase [Lachnospiraceae bacterium]